MGLNPVWPAKNDAESEGGGSNPHELNLVVSRLGVVLVTLPPSLLDGIRDGMLKSKFEEFLGKEDVAESSKKKSASLRLSRDPLKS